MSGTELVHFTIALDWNRLADPKLQWLPPLLLSTEQMASSRQQLLKGGFP
jgi:hypothetical protein